LVKKFRNDFIFGTSTSSYQIEGAVDVDGRSPSIWDLFSKIPGKTYMGHTGDVACDHYHRYREDVGIMKKIGMDAYRFSIAWPRIFPERGKYNPKGMEFYKKLIAELKDKGIKPMVTLYHWDLPLWAYEMGGWLNRDSVKWFKEYAIKVFEELNDSVWLWVSHNEPLCTSIYSYYSGFHAPGHKNLKEALTVAHHVLLSHGIIAEELKKLSLKNNKIGLALNLIQSYPASNLEEDIKAASVCDGHQLRWFLDPLFKASYPEDMVEIYNNLLGNLDFIMDGDLERISNKCDFVGLNFYSRELVEFSKDTELKFRRFAGDFKKTEMGWEIVPNVLYDIVTRIRKGYTGLPIYITENGAAFKDKLKEDKRVHDDQRIEYLKKHLKKVAQLNEEGMDIKGYFLWSLIDNFEWQYGYSKRFGIVYIDYETQERILKDSALWYKELIKKRVIK
jgi:beta-glucosidase